METINTINEIGLVFAMHKSGSSTVMQAFREIGLLPERGYAENVDYLLPHLNEYNGVVTPVRDPVARAVSDYFERNGDFITRKKLTLDEIKVGVFKKRYPDWFNEVYKPLFNVDVFSKRFPKAKGWQIIDDRYLLIQTEQLEKLPDAFEALYGKRPPSIHRARTVETRPYGKLYQKFVDWVRFPANFLDDMYGQKYVKHFYSVKQVEEMRKRWEEK